MRDDVDRAAELAACDRTTFHRGPLSLDPKPMVVRKSRETENLRLNCRFR